MSNTQSEEQRIDEIVDQDVMYENLGLTEANAKILKKYLRNAIRQHTLEAKIDENRKWQKLLLEREEIHSTTKVNVLDYEKRIEDLESQKKKG